MLPYVISCDVVLELPGHGALHGTFKDTVLLFLKELLGSFDNNVKVTIMSPLTIGVKLSIVTMSWEPIPPLYSKNA